MDPTNFVKAGTLSADLGLSYDPYEKVNRLYTSSIFVAATFWPKNTYTCNLAVEKINPEIRGIFAPSVLVQLGYSVIDYS